jgi:hypothetical protein
MSGFSGATLATPGGYYRRPTERSGEMKRTRNKRLLHIDWYKAVEGVKVEIFISPSLLRGLARQWKDPIRPPHNIELVAERHNVSIDIRGKEAYQVTIIEGVEDYRPSESESYGGLGHARLPSLR